jgi:hypothetical protein
MQTYDVDFRTDADYATHSFKARSPRHALKKALAFYDRHTEDLMFTAYDGGHPINEIEVFNEDGCSVGVWQDDDMRLRLAARALLDAGALALRELRSFYNDGQSEAVRVLAAAIARAKNPPANDSPPVQCTPDVTDDSTAGAAAALQHFQYITGCDYEDSLGDLLRDLMHWGDRNNFDFECALFRAQHQYAGGRS